MNKKKLLTLSILTLLWTGFIFSMSLNKGEASAALSGGLLNVILDIISPLWENIFGSITDVTISAFHLIIRKAAHFTEFAVLGGLAFLTFLNFKKLKCTLLFGLGYGTLVAALDETLQLFVEGRAGRIGDVLIDFCGVAFGVAVIKIFFKIRGGKNAKGNKRIKTK